MESKRGRKPKDINPISAKRLNALLEENGMTGVQVANRLKYSTKTVSGWRQGKARITEDNAKELSTLFDNVSPEWILGTTDYRNDKERISSILKAVFQGVEDSAQKQDLLRNAVVALLTSDESVSLSADKNKNHNFMNDIIICTSEGSVRMNPFMFDNFVNKIAAYAKEQAAFLCSYERSKND